MKQLAIDFNPDITHSYRTCAEYVSARVHQQGVPQKSIAADMDYSPSQLSQKLGSNDASSARFTLDDLELYVDVTGDKEPIKYLAAKYLHQETPEVLQAQIDALLQKQAEMQERS